MIHRVTTSDNEWQPMTTSATVSDNERKRVTANGHFAKFPVFLIREEPTTMHPKQNFLNSEKDLEERLLN